MITLEGAQAGLSWITILRRREGYRAAFDRFDPAVVAGYGEDKLAALLQDTRIVRNGAKIRSTVTNARAFMQVQAEFGSFDAYIWAFVDGRPILNTYASWRDVPARTPLSDAVSKDLKKHGFTFVGSTICYAIMQATGMVNDHLQGCHCRESASQRVRYA
jgi:DNA-3-methyladenine glycosylase I